MNRIFAALALACALAVSACIPKDGTGPGTSSAGWQQIGAGVGLVIGQTKYDSKVAKASEEFSRYCGGLRAVAMGASIFAPEKHQALARQAAAAVNSVCDNPPADVASVLPAVIKAWEAVLATGKASGVAVQSSGA